MTSHPHQNEKLVTVAHAYGPMEWSLATSMLGAANIHVFAFNQSIASISWDKMIAWGGVAIRVPVSQADDAFALLERFSPTRERGTLDKLLVALLVFLLFNVPPPPSGFFHQRAMEIHGERRENGSNGPDNASG